MQRYTVISADCHAGATDSRGGFTQYVDAAYRDRLREHTVEKRRAFNESLAKLFDPEFMAEQDDTAAALEGGRSGAYDADRRIVELQADGIVADVIFPDGTQDNTTPFDASSGPGAKGADWELQTAGAWAYNRWLADFCAQVPGRRAGIAQVLLHDIDAAVNEIRWAKDNGLAGGVLLPGTPPGSGVPPLYDVEHYAPLWAVCEELQMPVNHHSGSAVPPMGDSDLEHVIFILEVTWWAHRLLPHLIFAGVMERHPDLQFVFTEQGTAWIPEELFRLDFFADRFATAVGSQEHEWGFPVVNKLSLKPSEYWKRQCHVGSSFIRPAEVPLRNAVGVDKIMWGSDYPHKEASFPFSREAIRLSFAGVASEEIDAMLGRNAAALYGFDYDALSKLGIGPFVAEMAKPITAAEIPRAAEKCPAFVGMTGGK
jgi:predicted TIM-barrel fold metal-dependent hydrolase